MEISDKSVNHLLSNKVIEKIQITKQKDEKILCNHCLRTSSNGIRCMGICVADNDYWKKLWFTYELLIIILSNLFLVWFVRLYLWVKNNL